MASFGSAYKAQNAIAQGTSAVNGEANGTYTYTAPAGGFAIVQHTWGGSVQPTLKVGGKQLTGSAAAPETLPKLITGIYVGPGQTISSVFAGASSGYVTITGTEYTNS